MKPWIAGRRGQATIELALALTTLLLFSLGAVQFGILYSLKLRVEHAAREGARYGAIHVLEGAAGVSNTKQHAVDAAPDLNPPLATSNVDVQTPQGAVADKPVAVTVTYPYTPTIPLVKSVLPSSMSIRSQVQMRIEG